MLVDRELPTQEARDLVALTRELADAELAPKAGQYEHEERFPREVFRLLGDAGLLGLPFGEDVGGGGQPYEVYLQVVEELAARWASVALGRQRAHARLLPDQRVRHRGSSAATSCPDLVGGGLLGAYCLSEAHAGSDPGAMRAQATPADDGWLARGEKAWVTHGGHADFYSTFLRTPADGERGHLLLPPHPRPRRVQRRQARGEDGADRLHHGGDPPGRRPDPGRPARG